MSNKDILGYVHSFESFGLVDGPGVRCVVFLQGCSLRCQFCHNPETWHAGGEQYTAEQLWKKVYRYKNYWKNNGGVTVSGGEPLLQIDFLTEFFKLAKQVNVHTALDTAGQPFCDDPQWLKKFSTLMQYTDLVILDLKMMDDEGHKKLTGRTNSNILAMARWLSDNGKTMWIRHVLVPELTDDKTDLETMHKFISELKTVERVEILPYHTLGLSKWIAMGLEYPLDGVNPPTENEVKSAEAILHTADF